MEESKPLVYNKWIVGASSFAHRSYNCEHVFDIIQKQVSLYHFYTQIVTRQHPTPPNATLEGGEQLAKRLAHALHHSHVLPCAPAWLVICPEPWPSPIGERGSSITYTLSTHTLSQHHYLNYLTTAVTISSVYIRTYIANNCSHSHMHARTHTHTQAQDATLS